MNDFKSFFDAMIQGMSVIEGSSWQDHSEEFTYCVNLTKDCVKALEAVLNEGNGDVFKFRGAIGSLGGNRLMLSKNAQVGFSGDFNGLIAETKKKVLETLEKVNRIRETDFPLDCEISSLVLDVSPYVVATEMFESIVDNFSSYFEHHIKHACIYCLDIPRISGSFSCVFGGCAHNIFGSFDDLNLFLEKLDFSKLVSLFEDDIDISALNDQHIKSQGDELVDAFCRKTDFVAVSSLPFQVDYVSGSVNNASIGEKCTALASVLHHQGYPDVADYFKSDLKRQFDSGVRYQEKIDSAKFRISAKAMKNQVVVKMPKMLISEISIYLNKYCKDKMINTMKEIERWG